MRTIFTVDRSPEAATGGLKFEKHYPVETAIAVALMFFCLLGFQFVAGRLFRFYYTGAPVFAALVPAMAALGFVPWISYTSHPYDLTTLLLSSLLYWFMARERWRVFLVIFALSCTNKETAVLSTVVFFAYQWAQGNLWRKSTAVLLSCQIAIYALTKTIISFLFRANPGGLLEFHILDINAGLFAQWIRRGYTLSLLTVFTIFVVTVCYDWRNKPLLFRSGLAVIPFLALLGLFFGVFDEWRQYTDAYTPLLLLVVGTLGKLFGAYRKQDSDQKNYA